MLRSCEGELDLAPSRNPGVWDPPVHFPPNLMEYSSESAPTPPKFGRFSLRSEALAFFFSYFLILVVSERTQDKACQGIFYVSLEKKLTSSIPCSRSSAGVC